MSESSLLRCVLPMSISSRTWGPVMMGSRPFGLGGRSKVVRPLSLNRSTHSYTMVTLQPMRLAASASEQPRATSVVTRYRSWSRTASGRSLTSARNTRCPLASASAAARSWPCCPPLGTAHAGHPIILAKSSWIGTRLMSSALAVRRGATFREDMFLRLAVEQ